MCTPQEGPDPVSEIVQELQDCNAAVCYAVDATQLAKSLQARRYYALLHDHGACPLLSYMRTFPRQLYIVALTTVRECVPCTSQL